MTMHEDFWYFLPRPNLFKILTLFYKAACREVLTSSDPRRYELLALAYYGLIKDDEVSFLSVAGLRRPD